MGCDLWYEVTGITKPEAPVVGTCGAMTNIEGKVTGQQLNTNTAAQTHNFDYGIDGSTTLTAGNSADHHWVQLALGSEGIWDMGSPVSQVWLVPSIDHDPYPGEANETLIYYGDSAAGPWTLAARVGEDANGPSNWDSDNFMGKWQFTGSHQFVRAMSTQSNLTDAATVSGSIISDETEIDGICAVNAQ